MSISAQGVINSYPLVGVLSTGPRNSSTYFGKRTGRSRELYNFARKSGFRLFFFYPYCMDFSQLTIKGFIVNSSGRWEIKTFPLPDIVYNRILYRREENQPGSKRILQFFSQHPDIHFFNSRFFNKSEIYKALGDSNSASQYLPASSIYSFDQLIDYLDRYNTVFLKPAHSSKGVGLIRIQREGNGYTLLTSDLSDQYSIRLNKMRLKRWLQNRRVNSRYTLQQGVELARFQDRIFDLRTLAQKDGRGKWVLSGIGVRIAGAGRCVTHIPNGGEAAKYEEIINKTFAYDIKHKIDEQIKNMVNIIPAVLEENLNLSLVELSMDIGLDNAGRTWLLEANSKPARFDETEIRHRHMELLFDYFRFLANKN